MNRGGGRVFPWCCGKSGFEPDYPILHAGFIREYALRPASVTRSTGKSMKIAAETIDISCPETEIYHRLLALDGKHILELGCGSAAITRDIATSGADRIITALEVDRIMKKTCS